MRLDAVHHVTEQDECLRTLVRLHLPLVRASLQSNQSKNSKQHHDERHQDLDHGEAGDSAR